MGWRGTSARYQSDGQRCRTATKRPGGRHLADDEARLVDNVHRMRGLEALHRQLGKCMAGGRHCFGALRSSTSYRLKGRRGMVKPDEKFYASYQGASWAATFRSDREITVEGIGTFTSLTAAAKGVGAGSWNGGAFWKVKRGDQLVTVEAVRNEWEELNLAAESR